MTFVPIIPIVAARRGMLQGKPSWLKLESGEVFVRAYGAGADQQRRKTAVSLLVALVLGVLIFTSALGGFFATSFDQNSAPPAAAPPAGTFPWISIAIGAILVINIAVVVALKASRRGKAAAYLTTKMLVVRQGSNYAGVPLTDITAIQPGVGADQYKLIVMARTAQQPVAVLPVAEPVADLAELVAYSKAAGAKLQ